ncbi:hypothetical protein HWD03_gp152 [Alteromonas phage vB_AmeM_PT11-V22]|uniref:Uncharacterized protein n=1 Tax=Alteromonas phage vB_AmeM_PT11-V22 TaxID=2704031 RepID=A0A6C0R2N9_9CAUD|nr:hypothetical protein HWD03_gp152 [Alteromonas phage vB_AmeM_PT11-V22]QHZ59794.1 hypothetical protein [Alteromonas phage vB_AmeM_PT11-V22]
MSRAETFLQCSDCLEKLNTICDKLGYDDSDREIVAEVLLFLEMEKLKDKATKVDFDKIFREYNQDNPLWSRDRLWNNYEVTC